MSKTRNISLIIALAVLAVATTACEIIGYDTPVVGSSTSAWETVQDTDPVTGHTKVTISTHTRSNSFFGRIISLITGSPSFSASCIKEEEKGNPVIYSINWKEAIGSPNQKRLVVTRTDSKTPTEVRWTTSVNGRISSVPKAQIPGFHRQLKDASILATRTTNASGKAVTLVFAVGGYDTAIGQISEECNVN